jgi:polyisoprenoid-binding protein YceI
VTDPVETEKKRSPLTWILGGMVGVLILAALVAVGGTYIYIHFIEGPAPKPLTLPKVTTPKHSAGTWQATGKSVVGYRVNEVLFGQNNVAVGRTNSVTGSITVDGASVGSASFTAQMADVHSDQSERDGQFDGRIMEVSRYPTATFALTSPISLGRIPAAGVTVHETATGNLMLHGQTHAVTFPVSARYSGTSIDVTGSIPVTFADYGIENPSFAGTVTTDSHGTLEFLLVLDRSTGS